MKSMFKGIMTMAVLFLINLLLIAGVWYYFSQQKWEIKYYSIPEDFIYLPYYIAEKGEYLGRKGREEIDVLGGVYTLKDMPSEQFVIHEQYYLNNGPSDVFVYMDRSLAEPILSYDVRKIEFHTNGENVVIEDKQIINNIVSIIRNSASYECEAPDYMNTFFSFDLECDMGFQCYVECVNDKIYIICFNIKDNCWYTYDVTAVLKDFL